MFGECDGIGLWLPDIVLPSLEADGDCGAGDTDELEVDDPNELSSISISV
jgi:hypothetical protein